MSFTNAEEVVEYIGGIFEAAFADEEIGPKLVATGIVLEFVFTEPDSVVIVDAPNSRVYGKRPDGVETAATMRMTAATGNAYWQGKVNLPLAMAKGRIKVDGNVASLLKLAPLGKKLYPVYVSKLTADSREDLLV